MAFDLMNMNMDGSISKSTSRFNPRAITQVFINIVNGLQWKRISGDGLPRTMIDKQSYDQYDGYQWLEVFQEERVVKDNVSSNINDKSVQPKKPGPSASSHSIKGRNRNTDRNSNNNDNNRTLPVNHSTWNANVNFVGF